MLKLLKEHIVRFLETDPPTPPIPAEGEENGRFQEAGDFDRANSTAPEKGTIWEATILRFGKSQRAPHFVYTKENISRNLEAFEGARIYANSQTDDFGHKRAGTKTERDVVGILTEARITESALVGNINIMPAAKWLKDNLLFLESKKKLSTFQLSIDATGVTRQDLYNGEKLPHAVAFHSVDVDVVARGAAGGKFNRLIESINHLKEGVIPMKNKLLSIFLMLYPQFLESKGVKDYQLIDENQLWTYLLEADKPQSRLHLPDGAQMTESLVDECLVKMRESFAGKPAEPAKPEPPVKPAAIEDPQLKAMKESMTALQRDNCTNMLEASLGQIPMPEVLKKHVRTQLKDKIFTQAEMKETIKTTRDTFADLIPANPRSHFIEAGEQEQDKIQKGILGLFLEASPHPLTPEERKKYLGDTPALRSLKEGYILITGDKNVTGRLDKSQRFTESLQSGTLSLVLQDAIHVAMAREYGMMNLNTWEQFVNVVPRGDFRTNHLTRWGGYGDLPAVAEGAPYVAMTSPTDEEATYAVSKRGGLESVTLEMIKNDNVAVVGKIPLKLARAAAWTLHRFVYDFIKPGTNPTIYDTLALYHATHANTATTAMGIDGVAIFAAYKRMAKQTERDSSNRLGIRGKHILVPVDLEDSAYKSVTAAYGLANQTPTFIQKQAFNVIQVPHFDDATDWVLVADPGDVQGLELGFLDGEREPAIFVSDIPNVGSFFTNDEITFKIRHIYGGSVTDFRAFDGSIVA